MSAVTLTSDDWKVGEALIFLYVFVYYYPLSFYPFIHKAYMYIYIYMASLSKQYNYVYNLSLFFSFSLHKIFKSCSACCHHP